VNKERKKERMKGTGLPSIYITRKRTLSPRTYRSSVFKYATAAPSTAWFTVNIVRRMGYKMLTIVALVTGAVDLSSAVEMAEPSQQVWPELF
jgi:hypothetical protein